MIITYFDTLFSGKKQKHLTKISEKYKQAGPIFICDFSPPRGGDPLLLDQARNLSVDLLSIAYNPSKSARMFSAMAAHWIKENTGLDTIFSIATRDINILATQSLVIGSQLLGLDNILVLKGDEFNKLELSLVKDVNQAPPTRIIKSIAKMNEGVDYKGLKLRTPTDICIGATIDLSRNMDKEIHLTGLKINSGADYFVSQPICDPEQAKIFLERCKEFNQAEFQKPIFHGVQIVTPESIPFGNVPNWVLADLKKGRSPIDICIQTLNHYKEFGFRTFYLIPPILKGGIRDYDTAQAVVDIYKSENLA